MCSTTLDQLNVGLLKCKDVKNSFAKFRPSSCICATIIFYNILQKEHVTKCLIYVVYSGHSIAEAVSRWRPTAAARVRARVREMGFVVDKVASVQVSSEYFGLPCQNCSFHQLLHHNNHPGKTRRLLATS
jgi:hypothetical protein